MRKGCIIVCSAELVPLIERGCVQLGDVRITGRRDIFEQDSIELRLEGDGLPDDYKVGSGSYFMRKDIREDDPYWKRFFAAAVNTEKVHLQPEHVHARVGNVVIEADHHGMGFTCSIDGDPVKKLRSVRLELKMEHPNLITVEFLPEHANV